MNLRLIAQGYNRKLINKICKITGRDTITFLKIEEYKALDCVGSEYGGWIIPVDLINKNSICYCVGCGEDISFDLGLIKRFKCKIWGYDPTPRAIEYVREQTKNESNYHFYDIGLWDHKETIKFYQPKNPDHISHSIINLQQTENYFEAKVDRLSNIMKENGHSYIDLLKIDIEGAEYKVIESIVCDKLNIKIICIEFDECHTKLDDHYTKRIRSASKSLAKLGYKLINIQGCSNYTFLKN